MRSQRKDTARLFTFKATLKQRVVKDNGLRSDRSEPMNCAGKRPCRRPAGDKRGKKWVRCHGYENMSHQVLINFLTNQLHIESK